MRWCCSTCRTSSMENFVRRSSPLPPPPVRRPSVEFVMHSRRFFDIASRSSNCIVEKAEFSHRPGLAVALPEIDVVESMKKSKREGRRRCLLKNSLKSNFSNYFKIYGAHLPGRLAGTEANIQASWQTSKQELT